MTSAPDGPDWRSRAIHVLAYVATQTDERLAGRGPLEAGPIDSPEHVAATRAVRFCLELAGAEEGWWQALVEANAEQVPEPQRRLYYATAKKMAGALPPPADPEMEREG